MFSYPSTNLIEASRSVTVLKIPKRREKPRDRFSQRFFAPVFHQIETEHTDEFAPAQQRTLSVDDSG